MAKKKGKGPKLDPQKIQREYGYAYSFFKSDPELFKLVKQAVAGTWTAQRFTAKLQTTKWYKQHADVWRENDALKYTDPSTYKQRMAAYSNQVQNIAGQWGIDLDAAEVKKFATRGYMMGWNADQLTDSLANQVTPDKAGDYGGQLASMEASLKQTALNNGIRVGAPELQAWMKALVKGNATVDQYETHIRNLAANTFSAYGTELKSGMNLSDIASPYVQSMSDILEMNPASINMYDPTIRKALSYQDPKTGAATPMSITSFEDSLRADPRWQYTQSANQQMMGYANAIGKAFGVLGND